MTADSALDHLTPVQITLHREGAGATQPGIRIGLPTASPRDNLARPDGRSYI